MATPLGPIHPQPGEPQTWRHDPLPPCPDCGHINDALTHIGGPPARPLTGDYTLCAYCAKVSVFCRGPLGQLALREPTTAETAQIATTRAAHLAALTHRFWREPPAP